MDSQVTVEGYLVDLVDDSWRSDSLPEDDIAVPTWELPDPEADSGDIHFTLKEQEQKWTDILLTSISIGKHCSSSDCKQLDFLPLKCKCGSTFCSDHFNLHVKICETSKYLTADELRTIENVYTCSNQDCKERDILPLLCERCKKHFCIKHRHLSSCYFKDEETIAKEKEKYAAPVKQFNKAKAVVDEELENKWKKAQKASKHHEMAIKLQLMKIKNKAIGLKSIPTPDRLYLNVSYLEKYTPVFVSTNWSVGKAIDAIAECMKLQNNNHKSCEMKLRLFKSDSGVIISENMSIVLRTLLEEKIIIDGETLVIKYVDNDCLQL